MTLFINQIDDPMLAGSSTGYLSETSTSASVILLTTTNLSGLNFRFSSFINGIAPLGPDLRMNFISSAMASYCSALITPSLRPIPSPCLSDSFPVFCFTSQLTFVLPVTLRVDLPFELPFNWPFRHSINLITHPKVLTNLVKGLHKMATDSRKRSGKRGDSALFAEEPTLSCNV